VSPSNVNANIYFGYALAKANVNGNDGSDNVARLVRLSLVMTTSTEVKGTAQSVQFSDELMIRAKHGLSERQSEENMVKVGMTANSLSYFRFCVHCFALWF
jgi:hypothetical protein